MKEIKNYIDLNTAIIRLYELSEFADDEYLFRLNEFVKAGNELNNKIINRMIELHLHRLDSFIQNELCQDQDYYLLKHELHLRLLFSSPKLVGKVKIQHFIECLIKTYNSKDPSIDYERAIYLASLLGEYLLNTDFEQNERLTDNLRQIQSWTPSETGNWYGFKDHKVKLKSFT
ncbi:MAG: hypothetical protein JJU02_15910 [Cryomorphaceae bacterium]|nr:hypothetical protein [Cryomorphaceae bacterium]